MIPSFIPPGCRELIHALNQRYRETWDRAERLQAEMDDIKHSRAYFVFRWLRNLRRLLLPSPLGGEGPGVRGATMTLNPSPLTPLPQGERGIPQAAKVSILIPFRDHLGLLRNCLRSLRRGSYRRIEILLLDNGSTDAATLRYLRHMEKRRGFRVIACPGPFDFAKICNRGAQNARGDYLLFLNNDIEVLTADWLEQMLHVAEQPQVGIVGATLLYPDGAVQHAGIEPLRTGIWQHIHRGESWERAKAAMPGPRVVSAATGACLLIGRDRFRALGGFDERYPITHNDVDLCLRARERGWLIVVTPHARLMHFESLSRGYVREASAADDVE